MAISLILLPGITQAQDVVGSAIVDGRVITLFEDNTWEYTAPSEPDCSPIARGVEFCGRGSGWTATTPPNADIVAAYRYDDRHYGQMIIEEIGEEDGLTAAFMRDAVIQNAAVTTGLRPSEIPVIETYRSRVSGGSIETVVYSLNVDGLAVVFANSIRTAPRRTMQLMTYGIENEYTERHRDLHSAFLEQIRIAK